MCIHLFYPNPFGIHTVVFPICLAFIAYIIGSMSAVKNSIGYMKNVVLIGLRFSYEFVLLFCISMTIHKLITIEGWS